MPALPENPTLQFQEVSPDSLFAPLNREAWLTAAARLLHPVFRDFRINPYRVTCGWPCKSPLSGVRRRIGECHHSEDSRAGVCEIFISPCLDDPLEVLGTVAHELTHVVAGTDKGHGREFKRVAKHVGLTEGSATNAGPGPALLPTVRKISDFLGPYPHTRLEPTGRSKKEYRVTSLAVVCGKCGCKFRIGVKWLKSSGPPTCGCGGSMLIVP